jgi:hypothetical protein
MNVAIVVEELGRSAKSTLNRRRRRHRPGPPASARLLPDDWRALLMRWERRAPRTRWTTLLSDAGSAGVETAHQLHDWLLAGGWIETTEAFERGRWIAVSVEFRHLAALRSDLGLRDVASTEASWHAVADQHFDDAALDRLHLSLANTQAHVALRRSELLVALANWMAEKRFGTRRDFALFVRGSTKSITDSEWSWLAGGLELEACGVLQHAITIHLRAPAQLVTPAGRIDLGAAPDFISITATTVESALRLEGTFDTWRLVENRTSFERVARAHGDRDAVVWLPGYPPPAWRESVSRLVELKPATALIACDPDPDGIRIATIAGDVWQARGCDWSPWRMDSCTLAAVTSRTCLTERDRAQIESLRALSLHAQLQDLAQWMLDHGEKGEQEAYL